MCAYFCFKIQGQQKVKALDVSIMDAESVKLSFTVAWQSW